MHLSYNLIFEKPSEDHLTRRKNFSSVSQLLTVTESPHIISQMFVTIANPSKAKVEVVHLGGSG